MTPSTDRKIWSVTDLVTYVYRSLDQDELLKRVWMEAEISNFTRNNKSKHMYFTLKDDYAKIKAAMFAGNNRRLRFLPKDGDRVLVRGQLSMYDREGQIQFYAQDMRLSGAGDLYAAFERLKEALFEEGLFTSPKKNIPLFPQRVGVITSASGAALHDILTTMNRRFPLTPVLVMPVAVQGDQAPHDLAEAIERMNAMGEVDVIVVGRGGGSLEELWAFNEEVVARSIYKSVIPVISAVGHETDTTISDFVSDIRAATPTAAAEIVVPHQEEIRERISTLEKRLLQAQKLQISSFQNRLHQMKGRAVFRYPDARLSGYTTRLDDLKIDLRRGMTHHQLALSQEVMKLQAGLEYVSPVRTIFSYREKIRNQLHEKELHMASYVKQLRLRFIHLIHQLDALSPLNVMKRGYSLVYRVQDQKLITSQDQVQRDDLVKVQLAEGNLHCKVIE